MRLVIALLLALSPLPLAAQQLLHAAPQAAELERAPVLLVDIRQPHEWVETGVLPNARLIPFDDPASFLRALAPHMQPGQPVALICRSGNRTSRAGQVLARHLPVPVITVDGGMLRLMAQGYTPARPTRAAGCMIC
ncbi:MAG: rhodanese-like domain-containing protein [Pararhodobacter sp.]|nr:rhodanese-like domain-containing protein [Pararhodobacter sp.]